MKIQRWDTGEVFYEKWGIDAIKKCINSSYADLRKTNLSSGADLRYPDQFKGTRPGNKNGKIT
jgi:hypothetical protein